MAEPFLSEIRIMSFEYAPKGWALCNGQSCPFAADDDTEARDTRALPIRASR